MHQTSGPRGRSTNTPQSRSEERATGARNAALSEPAPPTDPDLHPIQPGGEQQPRRDVKQLESPPLAVTAPSRGDVVATEPPDELRALAQWLVWKLEERDGKFTKVPYQALRPRLKAKANDQSTWSAHTSARGAVETDPKLSGLGFVFTADDAYVGIDLDDCIVAGKLHRAAADLISRLDSYTELSPSGKGLHIIVKGSLAVKGFKVRDTEWGGKLEVYDRGRFFTFTGLRWPGMPGTVEPRQSVVDDLVAHRCADDARSSLGTSRRHRRPSPAAAPQTGRSRSDDEIVARIRSARPDLWAGDLAGYDGDHSSADFALVRLISLTTADDAQLDRVFRRSGLARDKWDREDYRVGTIDAVRASEPYSSPGVPLRVRVGDKRSSDEPLSPIEELAEEIAAVESGTIPLDDFGLFLEVDRLPRNAVQSRRLTKLIEAFMRLRLTEGDGTPVPLSGSFVACLLGLGADTARTGRRYLKGLETHGIIRSVEPPAGHGSNTKVWQPGNRDLADYLDPPDEAASRTGADVIPIRSDGPRQEVAIATRPQVPDESAALAGGQR